MSNLSWRWIGNAHFTWEMRQRIQGVITYT